MYNDYSLYIFRSKLKHDLILYTLVDDLKNEYIFNDISNLNDIFNYFIKNDIDFDKLAVICYDPLICYSFSRSYISFLLDNL